MKNEASIPCPCHPLSCDVLGSGSSDQKIRNHRDPPDAALDQQVKRLKSDYV
jgi:hypothetical protein